MANPKHVGKHLDILKTKQVRSIKEVLFLLAALLITIIGLQYIAQALLAPILLAFFFTALMFPLFRIFRKRGFSSLASLGLMVLSVTAGATAVLIFFSWSISLISGTISSSIAALQQLVEDSTSVKFIGQSVNEVALDVINPEAVFSLLTSIIGNIAGALIYLVVILVLSMLLLLQIDNVPKSVVNELSASNPLLGKMSKFFNAISLYMIGRLKVNTVTGIMVLFVYLIMGIPYAFIWAILTIILSFIPYVGVVLASIPPTLLAYSEGGVVPAIIVILAISVANLVAENVIEPYIQGKQTKISTAAIVIALFFWTWLLGPVGAILSTPLTVFMKLIFEDYKETQWLGSLMEGSYEQSKSEMKSSSTLPNSIGKWLSKLRRADQTEGKPSVTKEAS